MALSKHCKCKGAFVWVLTGKILFFGPDLGEMYQEVLEMPVWRFSKLFSRKFLPEQATFWVAFNFAVPILE